MKWNFTIMSSFWQSLLFASLAIAQQPAPQRQVHGGTPAVSPDGTTIAFVSERDGAPSIFVISADGTGERELTRNPTPQGFPRWSADGKQVVFWSSREDISHIYTIGADGKNQHEIAAVPGRSPVLSPDGKSVSYSVGPYTAARLWIAALDGSQAHPITDESSPVWIGWWSPDGKRIAFARSNINHVLQIWTMNSDGSKPNQLGQIPEDEGRAQWPAWSPDGHSLAVQVVKNTPAGRIGHIWIVDADTGAAHKIAAHQELYLDETPSWFPDGKRLAFQSNRTGRMEVLVMNKDGSDARQLTR